MIIKTKLSLALILCFAIFQFATAGENSSSDKNLERTVLFTMKSTERLDYNEYYVELNSSRNCFTAIVIDTFTQLSTFIFNGERMALSSEKYSQYRNVFDFSFLDAKQKNGYSLTYKNAQGETIVNLGGNIYGPYENAETFSKTGFSYKLAGRLYEKDKDIVTGPFNGRTPHSSPWYFDDHKNRIEGGDGTFSPDGNQYIFEYKKYNTTYLNINGKIKTIGESNCRSLFINNEGEYAYVVDNSFGNDILYFNDKKIIECRSCVLEGFLSTKKYAFHYSDGKNKLWYRINGKQFGPFDSKTSIDMENCYGELSCGKGIIYFFSPTIKLSDNGTAYAFNYIKNDSCYVCVNGSTNYGPFEDVGDIAITDDGKYIFSFKKDKQWHVNVNTQVIGDYDRISSLKITDDGEYSFNYQQDYNYDTKESENFKNEENGETYIKRFDYNKYEEIELSSPDGKHSFYSSYEYDYIVIDGESYANSPALHAWYNAEKKAFVWNAVESKDLIVYEFKL